MNVSGGTLDKKVTTLRMSEDLWKEFDQIAKENPTESTVVWDPEAEKILTKYYPITSTRVVSEMLAKVFPEQEWTESKVRAKARRMFLEKEGKA